MATLTLNNGVKMPQEGFGVYQIDDLETCKQAVKDALEIGYRSLDTAQAYHNEEAVGAAIAESSVDRQDIFLTTKVWISNYGYEQTKASVEESLRKLQTDYLDLVLLHQPYGDYYGAYRALEDMYEEGKLRAIGVSNFYPDRYVDLVKFNRIVPAVNQLETHVFHQRQIDREYLQKYGTQIESWGPFAEGRNDFFNNATLKEIGAEHDKTAAQVALRFLIQEGVVIIPKSTHQKRMQENLDIWDFALTAAEIEQITALDTKTSLFFDHADPQRVESVTQFTL
ncbi:aldo/keto reductase [Bombilactobacillus folatiphilus]|uniref:Aldo/keto reductase n=1 Tax=Bombilactobacillus folatiphilus TaxID=2923362 RepID=A0ABY4PB61_9LACO|nr:aldo/keto reductase [Bombilactobacillus folatiphilus]UQS82922.1 aldo/keto reductase [Bombilactobacillus folatiphilus]